MPLTVYHYPNCTTCRKALAWLKSRGVTHETVDIVKSPPSAALLARVAKSAGIPARKLFNITGEAYREGNFKERLGNMRDAEAFAALAADGKLIKRPLAIDGDLVLIGFDEQAWSGRLKANRP